MLLLRPHTASDLADCNPIMRRALAQVVHDNDNNGLTGKRTRDFARQGREGGKELYPPKLSLHLS